MATCDFCNEATSSPTLYPAAVVQRAALTGFRADGVATTEQVARSLGLTGLDAGQAWVDQVMADSTDWALCENCTRQLENHLRDPASSGRPATGRRPAGSKRQPSGMRPASSAPVLKPSPGVVRRRIGVVLELAGGICAVVFFILVFTDAEWWAAGLLFAGLGLMHGGKKLTGDR